MVMTRRSAIALGAIALAAAGGGAAVAAITDDHVDASRAAVTAALQEGTPTALDDRQQRTLAVAVEEGYDPDEAQARRILAPDERNSWTVIPTTDGGACLIVTGGTLTCSPPESISSGRSGLMQIKPATLSDDEARAQAAEFDRRRTAALEQGEKSFTMPAGRGGDAKRQGIAPIDAVTVEARAADGDLVSTTKVVRGLYELALGVEGTTSAVVFRDSSGNVVATAEI